jgi:hypothetical protein
LLGQINLGFSKVPRHPRRIISVDGENLKTHLVHDESGKKTRPKGSKLAPMALAPTPQQRMERALLDALQLHSQARSGRPQARTTQQRLLVVEEIKTAAEALPCALGPEHLRVLAQLPLRLELAANANDHGAAEILLYSVCELIIARSGVEMRTRTAAASFWVSQVCSPAMRRAARRGRAWSSLPARTQHVGTSWCCNSCLRPLPVPSPLNAGGCDPWAGVRRSRLLAAVAGLPSLLAQRGARIERGLPTRPH